MWVKSGSNPDSTRVTSFTCACWPQIRKWLEPYSWVWVKSRLKMADGEAKWHVDKRWRFGWGRWYISASFSCPGVLFNCSCTNNAVRTRRHCGRQSPQSISANAYTISCQRATQHFLVCHIQMSAPQCLHSWMLFSTFSRWADISTWKPSSTHFHLHHI